MFVCVDLCACVHAGVRRSAEGFLSAEVRITGICELPDVGAGKQA